MHAATRAGALRLAGREALLRKAQAQWNGSYNKSEWWHFQYRLNKQATFLDEMELFGYSEADLRRAGWISDAQLDHKPG
jgi:hypothetical protein